MEPKEPCKEIDTLNYDYQAFVQNREWSDVKITGEKIRLHLLYCPKCNPLGLCNQLFKRSVVCYGYEVGKL